ncbi:hypothetical protein [Nonomuraea sp. NPDC049784]|uniref:hypothetical protein n=1 Tax=Nonomuraea sp. NPDC049784 TaxID=3154361 RepID=UPI00340832EC
MFLVRVEPTEGNHEYASLTRELASQVSVEERERAVSRSLFLAQEKVAGNDPAGELIVADSEGHSIHRAAWGVVDVDDKTTVHRRRKTNLADGLEEQLDVRCGRVEFRP